MTTHDTTDRLNAWMGRYLLVRTRYQTGYACLYPLLGKRCKDANRPAYCSGCLGTSIADHVHYFRQPNTGLRLLVGQPYNPLREADLAMLDEARAMGLYVHVGRQGEGWWNEAVYPIIISNQPIPPHRFRAKELRAWTLS